MPPVPDGSGPFRERHQAGPLQGWLRASQGLVRQRMEDSWHIVTEGKMGDRAVSAWAVFDGLGGMPNGQEAAWAAADSLREAIADAANPEDVVHQLNRRVLPTRGTTTAVVALFPHDAEPGHGVLVSIGDSACLQLDERGRAQRVNPADSMDATTLTDFLGRHDPMGHALPLVIPPGGCVLLCTDGVDGVADAADLEAAMKAPSGEMEAALDRLFDAVHAGGAPDNATAIMIRNEA